VGRRHSIDTHKTKFLRKKQGGDIQSILAPKSARKRHSIDTRNRMSKEATFHRYLQYHSAGRRLLVDTCIFENQKPGFHAKTRLSRQNPAFMPKTWLSCQKPKSGFHANKTKTWLSCQKSKNLASMPTKQNLVFKKLGFYATKSGFHAKQTKIGFHATKQNLAPMPQNIWLPCHKTKTWLSRHKNRLSCQKPGFHAKQNFGFHAIQNLAFKP